MMASASENRRLVWALTVGHGSVIGDGNCGGAQKLTAMILKVIPGGHIGKALFEVSGLVAVGKLGVRFE